MIPVDPAEVERVVQEFRSKVGTQPAVGAEFHKVSEERFMSVDAKRNGNGNVTSDVDEFYASRQGYPGSGAGAEVPPPVPPTRSASVRTRDLPPLPPHRYMCVCVGVWRESVRVCVSVLQKPL